MIKKRYIIIALGIVSVLLVSLFVTNVLLALPDGEYDPWIDTNYDGIIDIVDVATMASMYGTEGTPINTTDLLLELEDRLDSLNASVLNDYYNITDCDSLFALLSHLHSGSDISGGTPIVDHIQLGASEGLRFIYFYEDGSPTGEYICWWDGVPDKFYLSDDTQIVGIVDAQSFTMDPTTRYYSAPSHAWMPTQESYVFYRSMWYVYTTTAGSTYWTAPVNLPHGAVVTELSAWVWDNSSTNDINVYLIRQAVGTTYTMAAANSLGTSPSFQQITDSSISYNPIDNQNYAYLVYGYLRSGDINHRLGKVRITYTIDEPLP